MNKPVHSAIDHFAIADDQLQVGGIPLTQLAARVGQTPFYAYDRTLLTQRVEHLRRNLPSEVRLHYAMKANPMPAVVQHMSRLVDGLDVASGRELRVALDTGVDARHVSFAGPGKSDAELSQAIASGIVVNVESESEFSRLLATGDRLKLRPRVALRVNPDFELKASSMKMGGGPKQFGIDADRIPAVLASMATTNVDFDGFHVYSGSQNLRPEAIIEAQAKTLELVYRLAEHAPGEIRNVNIGGGFGIPYFPGDQRLDLQPIGEALSAQVPEFQRRLPGADIVIELGRYLVGEAGIYVSRVIDRKVSRGQVFLIIDGGLHHHLAASGNFGQVIRKNYPVVVGNRMISAGSETASVVGPLCTPLDLIADKMELAHADVGDLIVVFQSGAYGLTASPSGFLSHPEAVEVLV